MATICQDLERQLFGGLMRTPIVSVLFVMGLFLAGFGPGITKATAQDWVVALTAKHAKQLNKLKGQKRHTAIAISPDGAWGTAYGKISAKVAGNMALGYCQQHLKPGRRDCLIYAVDSKVVVSSVVKTKVVSAVYKPVNGVAAAKFFGRVGGRFTGNRARASEDLQRLTQDPAYRARLVSDPVFESLLTNKSFMSLDRKAFAIWLSPTYGEQHMSVNSGIMYNYFPDWLATKDGLICFFDAVWDTGKPLGTRCIIVDEISNGLIRFSWGASPKTVRKAKIIAGDARFGAAR